MAKLDEEGQLDNPMKEEAAIANVDVEKVQEMEFWLDRWPYIHSIFGYPCFTKWYILNN